MPPAPSPLQRCGEAGVPASARRSHRSDSNADFRADVSCAIVSKKRGREQTRTAMKLTAVFTALAVAAGCVTQAHAQAYPSHPITIIVPFPAGGPSDTLARILGERMRVSLGQPVIVENVTGAGASIGVVRAAQSAPDGYTLGIGNWTSHVGIGRDVSGRPRRVAGPAADSADQRHAAHDRRQERAAAAERGRTDRVAQGEPRQGLGGHGGRRQRGACLLALLCTEDGHQFPARALIAAARRSCRI